MKKITIAIDGYSSCGKSTLAKQLAKRLAYEYIDTGSMFRAIALYCLEKGLILESGEEVYNVKDFLKDIDVVIKTEEGENNPGVYLNGVNVEDKIRTLTISRLVTKISGIKEVRAKLAKLQYDMGKDKGVVMDGRDIGTVIFPDAELKLFMTGATKIRVKRRYDELRGNGEKVTEEDVRENLKIRDHDDTTRKESPLVRAREAVVIDNTNLSKNDQLSMVFALANQRIEELNED
ncbi:MAG: cytidylate kinase [Saprospiraceae bacterium]|jgi:cytidylate kinase